MPYIWIAAIAALILVSVMTHKGKVFSGSAGEGFTMWLILSLAVSAGFALGIESEKKEHREYVEKHCLERGNYMVCKIIDNTDDEPPVSGSKWNEH